MRALRHNRGLAREGDSGMRRPKADGKHNEAAGGQGWQRLQPVTLVERAAEAIIAAAASGLLLPGDRVVEAEVARSLGISRVPVREALRMLESQGIVTNEPYKGIRLMRVDADHLKNVLTVRVALESVAVREILSHKDGRRELVKRLTRRLHEMENSVVSDDAYLFASADTNFHRELCTLSGNEVLCRMWEQIARQLTIYVGLSTLTKDRGGIVDEHRRLVAVLSEGRLDQIIRALDEHIKAQNEVIDFEGLVARQRASTAGPRRSGRRSSGRGRIGRHASAP
jgi:DNA-binding GntR family transcriptional regulator